MVALGTRGRVDVDHSSVLFSTLLGTAWEWGCRAEMEQPLAGVKWTSSYSWGLQSHISLEQGSEAKVFGDLWNR